MQTLSQLPKTEPSRNRNVSRMMYSSVARFTLAPGRFDDVEPLEQNPLVEAGIAPDWPRPPSASKNSRVERESNVLMLAGPLSKLVAPKKPSKLPIAIPNFGIFARAKTK